jgi:hypothetical protein
MADHAAVGIACVVASGKQALVRLVVETELRFEQRQALCPENLTEEASHLMRDLDAAGVGFPAFRPLP